MRKQLHKIILAALLTPAICFGQAAVRDVDLIFDTDANVNVQVSHKTSTGLQIDGTVTNSQDEALVDISGATVTCGFKTDVTQTNFFAWATGSVVDGPNGAFTVTFPASQWVTNISSRLRLFGDVRISNLGNTLPSIELWLYPSANTGDETTYVAPADSSWQTNGVDLGSVSAINFTTNITAVNNGGTVEVWVATSGGGDSTNGIIDAAIAYTDNATNGILAAANTYTDNATNGILAAANTYTDNATNGILAAANTYTDNATNGILAAANTYANTNAMSVVDSTRTNRINHMLIGTNGNLSFGTGTTGPSLGVFTDEAKGSWYAGRQLGTVSIAGEGVGVFGQVAGPGIVNVGRACNAGMFLGRVGVAQMIVTNDIFGWFSGGNILNDTTNNHDGSFTWGSVNSRATNSMAVEGEVYAGDNLHAKNSMTWTTNSMSLTPGTLNGTNGAYFSGASGTNYWILTP